MTLSSGSRAKEIKTKLGVLLQKPENAIDLIIPYPEKTEKKPEKQQKWVSAVCQKDVCQMIQFKAEQRAGPGYAHQRAGNSLSGHGLNWPHSNIYLSNIEGGTTKDSPTTESNQAFVRWTIASVQTTFSLMVKWFKSKASGNKCSRFRGFSCYRKGTA